MALPIVMTPDTFHAFPGLPFQETCARAGSLHRVKMIISDGSKHAMRFVQMVSLMVSLMVSSPETNELYRHVSCIGAGAGAEA